MANLSGFARMPGLQVKMIGLARVPHPEILYRTEWGAAGAHFGTLRNAGRGTLMLVSATTLEV